ncbi:MAG: hypothetical protein AMK73_10015 [Planctomycetes bacterium SM23_32]|nr:MAG: hypothetical protein AMK73_10015 [Planctomycetes bacterium SM23_32]
MRAAILQLEGQRLAALRARLREMLKQALAVQQEVSAETELTDELRVRGAALTRAQQLELAALAARQAAVGQGAGEALALLREDGSSAALPALVEGVVDDAAACADLLGGGDTGAAVRAWQREIEAALKVALEVLAAEQPPASGEPPRPREQPEREPEGMALLDVAGELRLTRTMQASVKRLTGDLEATRDATGRLPDGAKRSLERLAEGQRRVTAALAAVDEALTMREEQ